MFSRLVMHDDNYEGMHSSTLEFEPIFTKMMLTDCDISLLGKRDISSGKTESKANGNTRGIL